ncbi:UDP-glucose/GDP-mannose dehydrogenase family protein, partial [Methylicorpusculum sp.]|uniref:UDP-glucose dehydrogenase family protein n=1 Tax=Methylicorpusculum sp. TaxID=2713644 RepID=UPI002AB80A56
MKITVFGSGYVGLVTGACLAEVGNNVVCMDIDEGKINKLKQGIIPIYEPGLEAMVKENQAAGRLSFTTDVKEAVDHGLFQFIAVGTPPDEDGSADLQYVLAVAKSIAENMEDYRVVIDKSTVPVGTADRVKNVIDEVLAQRGKALEFDVVSNPEFLKEGAALDDFMKPDRVVIGTDNPRTAELLKALYAPFNRSHDRVIAMDIRSAELTKYAANAMLATKISFMNELANLAERLGADIENVRRGIGSDSRIGYSFIYPGCGYGGSCFPKDVKALERTAKEIGYHAELLNAVENVNNRQKHRLFEKISNHYQGNLKGKVFALWGLAFKPNTDDMRDAPSRVLLEALI